MTTPIATLAPCDSPLVVVTGKVGVEVRPVVIELPDVRLFTVEVAVVITLIPSADKSGSLRLRADMSEFRNRICME